MGLFDWLFGAIIMNEEDDNDDWRITAFEGEEYGISPFDYDTEEEYESAVLDAEIDSIATFDPADSLKKDSLMCYSAVDYGFDDVEDEDDYNDESDDLEYGWRDEVLYIYASEGIEDIQIDPDDYDTLDEFIEAFEEYKSGI